MSGLVVDDVIAAAPCSEAAWNATTAITAHVKCGSVHVNWVLTQKALSAVRVRSKLTPAWGCFSFEKSVVG